MLLENIQAIAYNIRNKLLPITVNARGIKSRSKCVI